jgi:nitrogen PTS system EIIA component
MNIGDLLNPQRVQCGADIGSKKRALEVLSELLHHAQPQLSALDIFNGLLNRERLGSTGIGHGIAIPHARLPGCTQAAGAVLTLNRAINFDASDGQPTHLFFALLVPEHFTDEHLQLLAGLAEMFSDAPLCTQLHDLCDPQAVCEAITAWHA